MTEIKEEEFKKALEEANELYKNGEWRKAIDAASTAMSLAVIEGNDEHFAESQNRRG